MKPFVKDILVSSRLFIFMSLLLGVLYPLAMTLVAQGLFPTKAGGSLLKRGDQVVGSQLIAQKFTQDIYFWPRPSAIDFNPLPSGGSNLGPSSADLLKAVGERQTFLAKSSTENTEAPQDLLFSSGSGLDPDISPAAASFQIARVAKARGVEVAIVNKIVRESTQARQFGFLGEPRVNVLVLNLALDRDLRSGK